MSDGSPHRVAVRLGAMALVTEFTLGAKVLAAAGVPYSDEGGGWIWKVHPGTYLAALAMLARLFAEGPGLQVAWRLAWRERGLAFYLFSLLFCLIYEMLLTGTGGLIMLVDTFLPAGMLAVALCDLSRKQADSLARLLRMLLLLNAVLALCEAASNMHFVPDNSDRVAPGVEFRSVALYDHPLTGASATMMGIWMYPEGGQNRVGNIAYVFVMLAALLAFGGRAALGMVILAGVFLPIWRLSRHAMMSRLMVSDFASVIATFVLLPPLAVLALTQGLGSRLLEHFYWDPSAQSRLAEFHLLDLLRWDQILFGCRRAEMIALLEPMRLSYGVNAIENFWLVIFIILGAMGFPVFVAGFFMLFGWLWGRTRTAGRIIAVCLFLAASTSNSLGHKSALLVMLVGMALAQGRQTVECGYAMKAKRNIGAERVAVT